MKLIKTEKSAVRTCLSVSQLQQAITLICVLLYLIYILVRTLNYHSFLSSSILCVSYIIHTKYVDSQPEKRQQINYM
jgi:hypothetical protein